MSTGPAVAAALWFASSGCHVFPCRPGRKEPATEHGFKDATGDPDMIRAWWAVTPNANVAIATGASNLAVIDLDGAEGIATWQAFIEDHPTERTLTCRTPSGGAHLYYADPTSALRSTARALGPGIDTRGNTGYVVAPPSRYKGRSYTRPLQHRLGHLR